MSLKSCVLAVLAGMALPLTVWAQPRAELTIGMYRIVAEVAADEPSRERGLMFRQHLGDRLLRSEFGRLLTHFLGHRFNPRRGIHRGRMGAAQLLK